MCKGVIFVNLAQKKTANKMSTVWLLKSIQLSDNLSPCIDSIGANEWSFWYSLTAATCGS